MEAIVAAVISALASIAVAVINQRHASGSRHDAQRELGPSSPRKATKWALCVAVVSAWVLVAPHLTNQPGMLTINFFVAVPVATLVLAYVTAPPTLLAASGVLAVHAVNAGVLSLSKVPGFMLAAWFDAVLLVGAFALNAILAAFVARWAGAHLPEQTEQPVLPKPPNANSGTRPDLTEQLAKLAKLQEDGKLTEQEFTAAKRKLLQ